MINYLKKIIFLMAFCLLGAFDRSVSFEVDGLGGMVSVPEIDGDHPIVFIMGDNEQQLLPSLESLDALVVWLDVAEKETKELPPMFETCREGFNRWLNDEAPEFGESLFGKGSFSQVVFIGIGEYADSVLDIARCQHGTQMDVSEIILIAPTRSKEASEESLPDIPISIALPNALLEENIVALTYFQALRQDSFRQSLASIVFAETKDPWEFNRFMGDYAAMRIQTLLEDNPADIGLRIGSPAPVSLFQTPVKSSLILEGDSRILDPKQFANPHENAWGKNHYYLLSANHFKGLTDMYQIKGQAGGIYLMEFDEALDMANREALSIYFNYAGEAKKSLNFTVQFKDMDGQMEAYDFLNQRPFDYGTGSLIPFYQERVVLDQLQMVDLTSIVSIALIFEEGISGEFNIGDISLSGYKDAPCG